MSGAESSAVQRPVRSDLSGQAASSPVAVVSTPALPTLEAGGHPLVYRSRLPTGTPTVEDGRPFSLTVEAETLDGMQKEGFVAGGRGSTGWRLPTDESIQLRGRDAAPQPLALHNAAVQACVLAQLQSLLAAHDIAATATIGFDSHFNIRGSFFRGDVASTVRRLAVRVSFTGGGIDALTARALARQALVASPAVASLTSPLANTFAIRLNGRTVALPDGLRSGQSAVGDPAARMQAARERGPVGPASGTLLEKLSRATVAAPKPGEIPVGLLPDIDRTIHVRGDGVVDGPTLAVRTSFFHPLGSVFAYRAAPGDGVAGDVAPSPLVWHSAAVAFCFMTQFHRYAEVHKLPVAGLRVVQIAPFVRRGRLSDGSRLAEAGPVDTHVFVDADFDAARCEDMLRMAHRTCFLHAALSGAQQVSLAVELDGVELDR